MTYRQKIIKIFDRLRPEGSEYAGTIMCNDVNCKECLFKDIDYCGELLKLTAQHSNSYTNLLMHIKGLIDAEAKK